MKCNRLQGQITRADQPYERLEQRIQLDLVLAASTLTIAVIKQK